MPDDKSKTDNLDPLRVAGGADFEIDYLANTEGSSFNDGGTLRSHYFTSKGSLVRTQRDNGLTIVLVALTGFSMAGMALSGLYAENQTLAATAHRVWT